MIFALWDLANFAKRRGRYARSNQDNPMRLGWDERLPDHVVELLSKGDILLTANFRSLGSWAIMYGTSTFASHVAMYAGDRKICHAVPGPGSTIEPIEALFGPDSRILAAKFEGADPKKFDAWAAQNVGQPYGYMLVLAKALGITSGRLWPYYRLEFFLDAVAIALLLDIPALLFFGTPIFLWFAVAYAILLVFHCVLWRFSPLDLTLFGSPQSTLTLVSKLGDVTIIGDAFSARDHLPKNTRVFRPKSDAVSE